MKIAITIVALALLAAGCASIDREARRAHWKAQAERLCPEKSRIYQDGIYASCRESGQLTAQAESAASLGEPNRSYWYNGNTAENVRNTPYQNARIDEGLARLGRGKN